MNDGERDLIKTRLDYLNDLAMTVFAQIDKHELASATVTVNAIRRVLSATYADLSLGEMPNDYRKPM